MFAAEHTTVSGSHSGPPVVFIHGLCSTADQDWPTHRWATPLAEAGRESVVIRLPGHTGGPGAASADEVTTTRLLEWLAKIVQSVTPEAVDVVGYSLGARLAWDLVGSGELPTRRLVLGGVSPNEPFADLDLAAVRAACRDGAAPPDPLSGAIASMVSAPGRNTDSLLHLIEGLADEPFDPAASPPAVPTLLIGGDHDQMTHGIEKLAAIAANCRVEQVPGYHEEALASDQFHATTWEFLQS